LTRLRRPEWLTDTMLRIACPYCGLRDETEFRYGGAAGVVRPTVFETAAWVHYLYWRPNPVGEHAERWLHVSGCRRWLEVRRDTLTNAILAVRDGTPIPESAS
jgi:heterotetrameric sarcosine oxidase delta subunit